MVLLVSGDRVPWPTPAFWPWLLLGALSQIVATGLMLVAMNDRSFVVTTAYLKTEAIQTAIFGFIFLGDHLTWLKVLAIVIATVGVVITALRPGGEKGFAEAEADHHRPRRRRLLRAVGDRFSRRHHRGAGRLLRHGGVLHAGVRPVRADAGADDLPAGARAHMLKAIFGLWKPSMLAGFMGAFASQFWFLAFALTAAANVRTLALVEVLFAQAVSYYSFKQPLRRATIGIMLIVIGVALLMAV